MILVILIGRELFAPDFKFLLVDFDIFIVRFICAILLHIQLEGEVRQGISMMKYSNNHPEEF